MSGSRNPSSILYDEAGVPATFTVDGAKHRLDVDARVNGSADVAGLAALNAVFGDRISAERRDFVSASFVYGRQPSIVSCIEQWDLTGVSGAFTVGEMVDNGATPPAIGFIDSVGPTPAVLRHIDGPDFVTGDTITGRDSGATATINVGTRGRCSTTGGLMTAASNADAATGRTLAQSRRITPYLAGHDGLGIFTARFPDGGAVNVNQYVGLLHDDDGYAVGYEGVSPGVLHRRAGVDTHYSAFNLDPLDGTGPSGFDIDWATPNIFRIQHGYLGAAGALFYIVDASLRWWPFHIVPGIGSASFPIILDPHLPVRQEVEKLAAVAGTYRAQSASWNSGTVGPPQVLGRQHARLEEKTFSGTRPVFSVRNKRMFGGILNRSTLFLLSVSVGSDGKSIFEVRRNGVLNNPVWIDEDTADSFVEVDVNSTTITGGKDEVGFVEQASGNHFLSAGDEILIQPGEVLSFIAQNVGSRDVTWAIRWLEFL